MERGGHRHVLRIGSVTEQDDGSLVVKLVALPVADTLLIRRSAEDLHRKAP